MYIYLIRHGETTWNMQGRTQGSMDIPLSCWGISQAEALAERLKEEGICHIYSSSLIRAYQTASIIGEVTDLLPEKRDELKEIQFGDWEGLTRQQIDNGYPGQILTYRTDFTFAPPNGEPLESLQNRIRSFIESLKGGKSDREKRVLLVAHAYPIRMLLIELLGLPHRHLWDFQLDNTGISIIRYDLSGTRIVCLNDTNHLKKI